jgi:hypothetical protein
MPILRERVVWSRARRPTETRASADLTPNEQRNAKAALVFLAKRFGALRNLRLERAHDDRRQVLAHGGGAVTDEGPLKG